MFFRFRKFVKYHVPGTSIMHYSTPKVMEYHMVYYMILNKIAEICNYLLDEISKQVWNVTSYKR